MKTPPAQPMTLAEARDWLALQPGTLGDVADLPALPAGINSVEAHLTVTWTVTLDNGEHASMTRPIKLAGGGTYIWVR